MNRSVGCLRAAPQLARTNLRHQASLWLAITLLAGCASPAGAPTRRCVAAAPGVVAPSLPDDAEAPVPGASLCPMGQVPAPGERYQQKRIPLPAESARPN